MHITQPSQTNQHDLTSRGPVLVDYECPSCQVTSLAPLRKVANGPVGYWCCEACDQAFRVRVDLELIPAARVAVRRPQGIQASRARRTPDKDSTKQQRMLELHGEALHLRSRLADVGDEILDLK